MESFTRSRPVNFYGRPLASFVPGPNLGIGAFQLQWRNGPVSLVRTVDGYKNPKWRSQVAIGANAGTDLVAFTYYVEDARQTSATFIRHRNTSVNGHYPTLVADILYRECYCDTIRSTHFGGTTYPSASLFNLALGRFYSRVYDYITPVKGGTILGELKGTLSGLRHPLRGMKNLLESTTGAKLSRPGKRGRRTPKEIQAAAADLYLEFTYGWKPLAHDVQDIINLAESQRSQSELIEVTELAESYIPPVSFSSVNQDPYCGDLWTVTGSEKLFWDVRIKGRANISVAGIGHNLASDFGLMPKDFLPTVWELLPYSFLIDYVSNLGDIVNAFSVPSSAIAWVNITERSIRKVISRAVPEAGNSYDTVGGAPCMFTAVTKAVRRTARAGGSLPLPGLAFELPNLWQDLNSLSLLLSKIAQGRS
jgi:hypothetical protein